jgi:hypothetical protein
MSSFKRVSQLGQLTCGFYLLHPLALRLTLAILGRGADAPDAL